MRTLQELKIRAAAINYSTVSVNETGELEDSASLLDKRIVEGYGCIWGRQNNHGEIFHRGAFAKSILENGPKSGAAYEIKFRDEHGRACALFETLIEDEIGLYFRTKPLDSVSWSDDLLIQLRSGTINNFSNGFGFIFTEKATKYNEDKNLFDIYEAKLFEISAVAIPSDMETFRMRSLKPLEMWDLTEDFIKSLPRKNQLEARHIFAQYKALEVEEPPKAHHEPEPPKVAIDYSYLINNI